MSLMKEKIEFPVDQYFHRKSNSLNAALIRLVYSSVSTAEVT
jgi:hypothetical protein